MKNFKNSVIVTILTLTFGFVYSNNLAVNTLGDFKQNNLCFSCLNQSQDQCNEEIETIENLEFSSLYKYNSTNFNSCHLNASDSKSNIAHKIEAYTEGLKAHENHLHKITYEIKNKHKNLLQINNEAAFNYVIVFDSSSTNHQKIIDYGIKLKL